MLSLLNYLRQLAVEFALVVPVVLIGGILSVNTHSSLPLDGAVILGIGLIAYIHSKQA
ncbi:hypothetical protein ACQ4M3_39765 [Leptolyngbya sp. AN03gr2]|uniref:hypothetical protein n=1 Tax=unclassified Leptolyngbya TaxID=2650499 RepID=UPI003D31031A